MPTDLAKPLKEQILVNLQALAAAGSINSYYSLDANPNPLSVEPTGGYPFAIVGMPRVASDYEDQATNKRTYRFDLLFVLDPTALQNPDTDVEHLVDAILNQFDNNFTLAGNATATVLPAEIESVPVSTGDKALLCVVVTLKCQTLYEWSNSNP
jgi:hypothetical protein